MKRSDRMRISLPGQSNSLDASSLLDPLLPLHENDDSSNQGNSSQEDSENTLSDFYSLTSYRGSRSNIQRILACSWFGFTSKAMWDQTNLPVLLYLLYPQTIQRVGFSAAIIRFSQILATFLTQYCLAPIWNRQELLQWTAFLGLFTVAFLIHSMLIDTGWLWLLAGLSSWGFVWGIVDTVLPSLFSDSLPEDRETVYYTRASRVIRSSNVFGPIIVFALFYLLLGNEWNIQNCTYVMIAGISCCIPMFCLLCCLKEVDREEICNEIQIDEVLMNPQLNDYQDCEENHKYCGNTTQDTEAMTNTLDSSYNSNNCESHGDTITRLKRQLLVHRLLILEKGMSGIASGVSKSYLPIFLVNQLGLSPSYVQVIYMITPLGQALIKCAVQQIAKYCSASCVTVLLQWMFVACLVAMTYLHHIGMSQWMVCLFFFGLSLLTNSTTTLTQAIHWSVIEGDAKHNFCEIFQLFLWSCGAATGGFIASRYGISWCFYTSASLQFVASLLILIVYFIGPPREKVNKVLFPDARYGHEFTEVVPTRTEQDEDGVSYGRYDVSTGGSESDEYFDCESRGDSRCTTEMIARYDFSQRRCIYEDGRAAPVPSNTCVSEIPHNYLAICNGNMTKAGEMWRKTQEWRRKNNVWKIHTLSNPWYRRIKECYPHYIHGFSKEGYPVVYEQPGNMTLKELFRNGCTILDMTTWYTFFMEYLSNCVKPSSEGGDGAGSPWGFVVVMDMKGAGISLLSSDVLTYLRQAGNINNSHYPLSMKLSLLVNSGTMVANVWKGVKRVLPSSVHAEVFKSPNSLLQYIDSNQIPPEYNGTSPYALGWHPDELRLLDLVQQQNPNE